MIKSSSLRVRVRYADVDRMSIAYHSRYFEWFEMARTEFMRATGKSYKQLEQMDIFLPVYEAFCKYRKPAVYDELLEIKTSIKDFKPTRIEFYYEVFDENKTLLAIGYTIHPFVNKQLKPVILRGDALGFFK